MSFVTALLSAIALGAVSPPTLDAWLQDHGYSGVPLRGSEVGHLHADATIQGKAVEVLVDTGASDTVVDIDLARELGLTLLPVDFQGAGMGNAALEVAKIDGASLILGDVPVAGAIYAMDFSALRTALAARGIEAPPIIIGAETMRTMDAVLDYGEGRLYLRRMPPASFEAAGQQE